MSKISGQKDHAFWHDPDGRHRHPHPSSYEPRRSRWTSVEKAYAAHLDWHEKQATDPDPLPDDGPAVQALFEHIENLQKIIAKERVLIVALRQRAAQAPDDMRETDRRVLIMLRRGGVLSPDDLDGEGS